MSLGDWDFDYRPSAGPVEGASSSSSSSSSTDVVAAFRCPVSPGVLARALGARLGSPEPVAVDVLVEREPIYWYRLRAALPATCDAIAAALDAAGLAARYVAPATAGSPGLGEPLETEDVVPARPQGWRPRRASRRRRPEPPPGWHLSGETGVAVDRTRFGRGGGRRLAVVDDDAIAEHALELELDAEVLVGIDGIPRSHAHGALMAAWATGARGRPGVAPDASARIYCVPKSGVDVVSVPRAIVLAAIDGADVILCPTHLEGSNSPMFDDALAFASRLGRRGLGALVVIPAGRDASSPPGSLHGSLTLALGDPASDPRVLCVGASARDGGWFLWRSRRGRWHPFANRGPALSLLAPGDDLESPFGPAGGLAHAESSGAAALAAGVALLVLGENPGLRAGELLALLRMTATPIAEGSTRLPVEPKEILPEGEDPDGHSAKHGHGRAHAGRACLVASDPVAWALVRIGEEDAARRWIDRLAQLRPRPYSKRLARWALRALLADGALGHAVATLARHLRLIAGVPARRAAHRGAAARHLLLLARALSSCATPRPPRAVLAELARLEARLRRAGPSSGLDELDAALFELATGAFSRAPDRDVRERPDQARGPSALDAAHA